MITPGSVQEPVPIGLNGISFVVSSKEKQIVSSTEPAVRVGAEGKLEHQLSFTKAVTIKSRDDIVS